MVRNENTVSLSLRSFGLGVELLFLTLHVDIL